MVALLVALSVMSVMSTVAMPVWRQTTQREKEEEYIFRARQYVRAIELFQRKTPGALPPNLDLLVEQKFLRKKFKDPITNDEFQLLSPSQAALGTATPGATADPTGTTPAPDSPTGRGGPGADGGRGGRGTAGDRSPGALSGRGGGATGLGAGRGTGPGTAGRGQSTLSGSGSIRPGGVQEGIIGVTSKSKAKSIRVFNGRTRYNEWIVQFVPRAAAPGAGADGTSTPGATNPPAGRGGRGNPNAPPGSGPAGGRGGRGSFGPGRGQPPTTSPSRPPGG